MIKLPVHDKSHKSFSCPDRAFLLSFEQGRIHVEYCYKPKPQKLNTQCNVNHKFACDSMPTFQYLISMTVIEHTVFCCACTAIQYGYRYVLVCSHSSSTSWVACKDYLTLTSPEIEPPTRPVTMGSRIQPLAFG